MDTRTAEHPSAGPARGLTCRDRAILRAVARGDAEIVVGAEPDLFLDGRCCSDQMAAHRLVNAGLITAAVPAAAGQRVAARLSAVARELLAPPDAPRAVAGRVPRRFGSPAGGELAAIA